MNQKTVYGLQHRFGGDTALSLPSCSQVPSTSVILEVNKENEPTEDNDELYELEDNMEQIGQDEVNLENTNWKKYTPASLATTKSDALKILDNICTEPSSKKRKVDASRRRPTTTVKALTSSVIADKYNILVDKRIAIADAQAKLVESQLKRLKREHELQTILLEDQLKRQNEEHELKMQILKLDIDLKKQEICRSKSNLPSNQCEY